MSVEFRDTYDEFRNRPDYVNIRATDFEKKFITGINRHGLITFDGVTTPNEFLSLASRFGTIRIHPMTDAQGVTTFNTAPDTLGDGVYASNYELVPHTDGTAMNTPADFLIFACTRPDSKGSGGSTFVDGQKLYKKLEEGHPDLLDALSASDAATFGVGDNQFTGAVFDTDPEGLVTVRFRLDKEVRYNDSILKKLPVLREELGKLTNEFVLAEGQGYIANNRRILHGRGQVEGERVTQRSHVDINPMSTIGQRVQIGFPAS